MWRCCQIKSRPAGRRTIAQVKVDTEAATVVWPNGADLVPETLYQEARKNPLIAA